MDHDVMLSCGMKNINSTKFQVPEKGKCKEKFWWKGRSVPIQEREESNIENSKIGARWFKSLVYIIL